MNAPQFNEVAPFYDALARLVFGQEIIKAQQAFLGNISQEAKILIIGGGTGNILKEITRRNTKADILFLEASSKMLQKAKKVIPPPDYTGRIEFRLGTEKSISEEEKFKVVLTPFFLDLFAAKPLQEITDILYNALVPGGYWLVTDFVYPSGAVHKKVWAAVLFSSMYLFFRITCNITATKLPAWENHLKQYHLIPLQIRYFYNGLIKTELLQKNAR
ncbi:class I SAM-dependent methyltransferase [Adhaeribacter aquaticus]|uniref:class I SAM-dependent methyltransferase n=1 Tax=Adhaeribacter aquaticus TaxID=299567 RepID=UPI0003FCA0D6|nr:class I SAM-dependent methyltransferase [Adhaeribacter aquaticus]